MRRACATSRGAHAILQNVSIQTADLTYLLAALVPAGESKRTARGEPRTRTRTYRRLGHLSARVRKGVARDWEGGNGRE